jgi:hypothetical protein
MCPIKMIAPKQISVLHQFRPSEKTATKKYNISKHVTGPLMTVHQNKAGEFLLIKNIESYNALTVTNKNNPFPCQVIPYEISKLDWCFALLRACFDEKAYFQITYEYINFALDMTGFDEKLIAKEVGCDEQKIKEFIMDKEIPLQYRELAHKHNRQKLVNNICRDLSLRKYRNFLYKAAFQKKNRLTVEKLEIFQEYISLDYTLDLNSNNPLASLNQIVDKKAAWRCYWNLLTKKHIISRINDLKNKKVIS